MNNSRSTKISVGMFYQIQSDINGKKKFKRILVEGEKFKLRKLHSKDFIALFSSRRRVCPVLKHN